MSGTQQRNTTPHSLAFLALLSFIASFLAARTFTTLFPSTVVVTGGIHFHHFWYGLVMVVVAGWLGIAQLDPGLRRLYAVVFGLGGGLIVDEAGLLLTLGNYHSDLTYVVVVAILAGVGLLLLFAMNGKDIKEDVISTGTWERVVYLGTVVAGLSALAFSVAFFALAAGMLVLGVALVVLGLWLHRGRTQKTAA